MSSALCVDIEQTKSAKMNKKYCIAFKTSPRVRPCIFLNLQKKAKTLVNLNYNICRDFMTLKFGLKVLPLLILILIFLLLCYKKQQQWSKVKRYESILIDSTLLSNETVLILVPSKVELR